MSCNGCRVLRKGCSDTCILRSCLQWIESPEAQGHATVFVAKFFGRAGMISFISAVSESQRPALFQSLLYEACGRTVNPVFGAVGLLWSGNWGACQAAVETVLKGGSLKPATPCVPASNKPIQLPISNKSPSPSRNASSKRPYNPIDTDPDINAEDKRPRSMDPHPELLDSRAQPEIIHGDSSVRAINAPALTDVSKREEERPAQSGQLVAPVARRVKPPAMYGLVCARGIREAQAPMAGENPPQACADRAIRSGHERVELDLTLNSHAHHINIGRSADEPRFDGKSRVYTGYPTLSHANHVVTSGACCNEEERAFFDGSAARVSSPCSFSMNSEGSVISSDTAEFSASCIRGFSPPTTAIARHEDCQLLHLL